MYHLAESTVLSSVPNNPPSHTHTHLSLRKTLSETLSSKLREMPLLGKGGQAETRVPGRGRVQAEKTTWAHAVSQCRLSKRV